MRVGIFNSLRFRLIASVVLIEIIMLSILVWNNLNTIYTTHTDRLSDTATSLIQQFSRTAGEYLFTVDYASLEEYSTHILKHSEVNYVVIVDINEDELIRLGSYPGSHLPATDQHPTAVTDGIYDVRQDIILSERSLGHVQIGFSMELMNQAINETRNRSIAIATTEIFLTVIVTILIGVQLTRDMRSLSVAAEQVGSGNYNITTQVTRKDELGLAAMAFNKMVNEIKVRRQGLEKREQQIRLLLNTTEEGIYGIDLDGRCTFVNAACLRMLGYQSDADLKGKIIHDLIHHKHPDGTPYPKEQCRIDTTVQHGKTGHSDDEVHWRSDGSYFPVEYWSHPVKQGDKITGAVVTFIDITQRKVDQEELLSHRNNLEALIEERTKELAKVNDELEAFSYSVSHDLRAPLRSIDGFSLALIEDYSDQLDDEARNYLDRVRHAAQRMGGLIDDLLELSRTSRSQIKPCEVDLSMMASTIVSEFSNNEPQRSVNISITPSMTVNGDERLLHVALENMLGNAWKYTGKEKHAQITFGKMENDGQTVYYIQDNGVGFDMAYHEKLFGPFERLHRRDEFDGTGIGLATTKRVIQLHHGDIWAESVQGQGSTFFFTLDTSLSSSQHG